MSIGNRLDEAYIKLVSDDLENALVRLSIAIEHEVDVCNTLAHTGFKVKIWICEFN